MRPGTSSLALAQSAVFQSEIANKLNNSGSEKNTQDCFQMSHLSCRVSQRCAYLFRDIAILKTNKCRSMARLVFDLWVPVDAAGVCPLIHLSRHYLSLRMVCGLLVWQLALEEELMWPNLRRNIPSLLQNKAAAAGAGRAARRPQLRCRRCHDEADTCAISATFPLRTGEC